METISGDRQIGNLKKTEQKFKRKLNIVQLAW